MTEDELWVRYWSFSRFDLRLSDQDFWSLTFRELIALQDRWTDQQRREDMRFGMLLAQNHNLNRGKNDKAVSPAHFFPSLETDQPEADDSRSELGWKWWAQGINEQQQPTPDKEP